MTSEENVSLSYGSAGACDNACPGEKTNDLYASVIPCSARPITYDETKCIGCGRCAAACQMDVLIPSVNRGEHPIVMYPGECMYCGACVMDCPVPGAIHLEHPLMNRTKFVPVRQ